MNSKILTLLGFASKSGNLSFGMDSAVESLKKGKSKLIIVASDISEKSRKEIKYFSDKYGAETCDVCDMETLSHAVGHKGGIISVNDDNFAKAIKGGNANGKN